MIVEEEMQDLEVAFNAWLHISGSWREQWESSNWKQNFKLEANNKKPHIWQRSCCDLWFGFRLNHGVCICSNDGQFEPRIHCTVVLKKSLEVHLSSWPVLLKESLMLLMVILISSLPVTLPKLLLSKNPLRMMMMTLLLHFTKAQVI